MTYMYVFPVILSTYLLTINVIDFEEENQFFIWLLFGELVHRIHKFCQGYFAISISVENAKYSLHKENLEKGKFAFIYTLFFK